MSRLIRGTGTFLISGSRYDIEKVSDAYHRRRRTNAMDLSNLLDYKEAAGDAEGATLLKQVSPVA